MASARGTDSDIRGQDQKATFWHEEITSVLIVLVIPELGCHPNLFANQPGSEEFTERTANMRFIPIDRRAVKMAIANQSRFFDCFCNSRMGDMV
jgi:hypothetical protein